MILLSAGHYPDSQGAGYGDVTEYKEAVGWVVQILDQLRRLRTSCGYVPAGSLLEKIDYINQIKPVTAVEIHFSANLSCEGSGSQTLFCADSKKGKTLATAIQNTLGEIFQPSLGVRGESCQEHLDSYRNEMCDAGQFLQNVNSPAAIVIKPEFIHNAEMAVQKRNMACRAVARVLADWAKNEGPSL